MQFLDKRGIFFGAALLHLVGGWSQETEEKNQGIIQRGKDLIEEISSTLFGKGESEELASCSWGDVLTALPQVSSLNVEGIGSFFPEKMKRVITQPDTFSSFDSMNEWNVYGELIGLYGVSKNSDPFHMGTAGLKLGASYTFSHQFNLGLAGGFFHTWLDIEESDFSAGGLNGLFVGPYFAYLFDKGYATLSVSGLYNQCKLEDSEEVYQNLNAAAFIESGYDISLPVEGLFLRPKLNLSYISIFENEYVEAQEGVEVFHMDNSHTSFVTIGSSFEVRKEYFKPMGGSIIPSLTLGYLFKRPIAKGAEYQIHETCPNPNMRDYKSDNQLVVGAELTGIHRKAACLSIKYEARLLGNEQLHVGKLLVEYDW